MWPGSVLTREGVLLGRDAEGNNGMLLFQRKC